MSTDEFYIPAVNNGFYSKLNERCFAALLISFFEGYNSVWIAFFFYGLIGLPFVVLNASNDIFNIYSTTFSFSFFLLLAPWGVPQVIRSYKISTRGIVVRGTVKEITGVRNYRLVAAYRFNNNDYQAITGASASFPRPGQAVLVAIDPECPEKYRIIPYDYHLGKATLARIIYELSIDHLDERGYPTTRT